MQIPGGMKFALPELNYQSAYFASFDTIVNSVMHAVTANPQVAKSKGWPMTRPEVEMWVESQQVAICEMNGWLTYLTSGEPDAPPPKFKALSPMSASQVSAVAEKVKKVWQGVKSLNDWIDSGDPAVPLKQSEARAMVCVKCPQNGKGGLEEWFTKPASAAIQAQFRKLESRKLATPQDSDLNVCKACLCPLRLLVHTPLEYKLAHMGEETRRALDSSCWILAEERDRKQP
jgi:hypothetical protein